MQLTRRGGFPGRPIIDPEKVDGYIQAIREKDTGFDAGSAAQFVNAGSYKDGNRLTQVVELEEETKSTAESMENSNSECEPWLKGGLSGLPADVPITSGISHLPMNHVEDPLEAATLPSYTETDFALLKVRVEDPIGFSAAMRIAPDDLHLLDCTAAEDPLRNILNTSGDWVHSKIKHRQLIPPTSPLSPEEMDIEEVWKSVPLGIPSRITPFLRSSVMKSNEVEKWTASTQSLETLAEFGSCRGKIDAEMCLDYADQCPNLRTGRRLRRQVVWVNT